MPGHKIQKDWRARLKAKVPFGLGRAGPGHFGGVDAAGGVPDYNARVEVEKIAASAA